MNLNKIFCKTKRIKKIFNCKKLLNYNLLLLVLFQYGCAKKSDVNQMSGRVTVQIGSIDVTNDVSNEAVNKSVNESTNDSVNKSGAESLGSKKKYKLINVDLLGISNLSEVSGQYAQFYYAPGASNGRLIGNSPRAYFIKKGRSFIPKDSITMQMSTLYYHLQNLAQWDSEVGAKQVNQWPRAVGIETQVSGMDSPYKSNNAFYNGQTDSMMFVPYTTENMPIAMNAGIIAHEHFHSLFYKLVLLPATSSEATAKKINSSSVNAITSFVHDEGLLKKNEPSKEKGFVKSNKISLNSESLSDENLKIQAPIKVSEQLRTAYYNETYLRGLNEGLADYWGWSYTKDSSFMSLSLPDRLTERSLELDTNYIGIFQTQVDIFSKVDELTQWEVNPKPYLIGYSYQIGTPMARFLKTFSEKQAHLNNVSLVEANKMVGKLIYSYLLKLSDQIDQLKENEVLSSASLFDFVFTEVTSQTKNSQLKVDSETCEFLLKYVNFGKLEKDFQTCPANLNQNPLFTEKK